MSKYLVAMGGGEACGARWALGTLLLAPLAAAGAGYVTVIATIVLGTTMFFSAFTCSDLKQLSQILPPAKTSRGRRERNLRSFCDFLSIWVWFLAHLVAVAICARILSATADHVTAGKVRRWLFGYETRALGEPWPDVLGVTVVLVMCTMFMCGLEESVMFTFLLLVLLYVFTQLFVIYGFMNFDKSNLRMPPAISGYEVFTAGSSISYTFSVMFPPNQAGKIKKKAFLVIGLPLVVLALLSFLYANMLNGHDIDAALPVTTLLEALSAGWMSPLLSAVTVAGVALALTELCPALFNVLVALASPEWKVLTRSMTYESATTGSPVLAVFTAGSLAAILAFACPLAHMITLMNASHLLGIIIQSVQLTVMRCVPTDEQKEKGDVEYKRLGRNASTSRVKTVRTKSGLWFLPQGLRHTKTLESLKAKVSAAKECEERECLLLDEYGARGKGGAEEVEVVDVGAEDSEPEHSDVSSGDDSTDIDAAVKEYKDRIQVVAAVPESANRLIQVAGTRGARLAAVGAFLTSTGSVLFAIALCTSTARGPILAAATPVYVLGVFLAAYQPAHKLESWWLQRVEGPVSLLLAVLFLTPLLLDSWPAILLFAAAGVVIYARCERWCGDLAIHQVRRASDRHKLHPSMASGATARLTHLDTVYITRTSQCLYTADNASIQQIVDVR